MLRDSLFHRKVLIPSHRLSKKQRKWTCLIHRNLILTFRSASESERAFNVNIRNAPIQEEGQDADAALANMANKLQMQAPAPSARRLGTVRGRREARNSFMSSPQQISENAPLSTFTPPPAQQMPESAPVQALETAPAVAERAVSPPLPSSTSSAFPIPLMSSPASPTGSFPAAGVAGAAGAVGVAGVAAASFSPLSSTGPLSPFRPGSPATQRNLDGPGADTGSIRSGRSLTSTNSQGLRHPELNQTGLSSSILETVSVTFENGQPIRSTLVGEIALAYNPADFSTPFGSESIRLDGFPSLEKVAPNPSFISQLEGKKGEYAVNLSHITKTQVAFKYQVLLDDPTSQAPILIRRDIKIEPTRTSIIVSYALNPSFALQGKSSVTLAGVVLALTLDGGRASSCQSKPAGIFSREKNQIFWQLGDVTLTPAASEQKLLARFNTEGEGKDGTVEAKWEITGENAQGLGSGLNVSMLDTKSGAAEGDDPFADVSAASGVAPAWTGVQGVKKLVSGSYVAK